MHVWPQCMFLHTNNKQLIDCLFGALGVNIINSQRGDYVDERRPGLSTISSSECQVRLCVSLCVWAREWESEIGQLRVKCRRRKSSFVRKASVSLWQQVNTLPVNFHWCTSRAVNLSNETASPCFLCVEMLCHLSKLLLCTLAYPENGEKKSLEPAEQIVPLNEVMALTR